MFNKCKQPYDKKNEDSENEDIKLIEPIIEECIRDEDLLDSMETCLTYVLYLILCST